MSVPFGSARAHTEIARLLASGLGLANPRVHRVTGNHANPDPGPVPRDALRFSIGHTVMCQVGTWSKAVVVKHWYREPDWETGR